MITPRVAALRQQSLDAIPTISAERAVLMTEAYRLHDGLLSAPMRRALAFRSRHGAPDDRHRGRRADRRREGTRAQGHADLPRALLPHPGRPGHPRLPREDPVQGQPGDAGRSTSEQIIPFWQGKTMRERLFAEMTDEWLAAYEAGVFTEFMEQRAPGPHRARRQDLPAGPS